MREARSFLIALVLIVTGSISAQDPPEQPTKADTCAVQGLVVSAATGAPLKSAQLTLELQGSPRQSFRELTGSNGHFIFTGIPPGEYQFRASKSGYVPEDYPLTSGATRVTLELEPGEKLDKVQFQLTRAAVILGRITDEAGEPVAGVEMDALLSVNVDDPRDDWAPEAPGKFAVTNDLGEYRIYDLKPGRYYLAANDSGFAEYMNSPETPRWQQATHPTLYYPGVLRRNEAQKIRVKAGQEVRIDLSLRSQKLLIVSGRVIDADGKPAQTTVTLDPQDPGPNFWLHPDYSRPTDVKGNFEIKGVLPGSYVVSAILSPATSHGNVKEYKEFWTEQRIELAGTNVSGLELRLRGTVNLSGRVTTLGGPRLDLQDLRVEVSAEGGRDHYHGALTEMKKDGTFRIIAVRPTAHRLSVTGLPDGWYLRSAYFGSNNVLEDGLQLSGADTSKSLEITVSPGTGQIEGAVLRGDAPVRDAHVKLLPDPANPHRTDLLHNVLTDENGHFTIKDVVPGSYRALAVARENDDEDASPDASDSISIFLSEKQSKSVQLKLPGRRE